MAKRQHNPDSFGFLVNDIARLYRAEIDRRIAQAGLDITPAEARTLVHAARMEPVRQTALAERMGVEAMTLSGYLDRLERSNLIIRNPDPDDRRAKLVILTEHAEAVLHQIDAISLAARQIVAEPFAADEWKQLKNMLKTIRSHLCKAPRTG